MVVISGCGNSYKPSWTDPAVTPVHKDTAQLSPHARMFIGEIQEILVDDTPDFL